MLENNKLTVEFIEESFLSSLKEEDEKETAEETEGEKEKDEERNSPLVEEINKILLSSEPEHKKCRQKVAEKICDEINSITSTGKKINIKEVDKILKRYRTKFITFILNNNNFDGNDRHIIENSYIDYLGCVAENLRDKIAISLNLKYEVRNSILRFADTLDKK